MGLRIATNVPSLVAQRNLSQAKMKQDKAYQKLSSGSRIVSAGDDAAGLAISEGLRGDIRSTDQAARNANDGISLIQTAEGGLNEITNILIRLRELSVQAGSDTIGDTGRSFSNKEFQHLTAEVERIAGLTEFNGRKLLNGEGGQAVIRIGIDADEELSTLTFESSNNDVRGDTLGISGLNIVSKEEAVSNLAALDSAIDIVNENRAGLGALQSRLQSTITNLGISKENLSTANSRIRDADIAVETSNLAKSNVLTNSSISVLGQTNNMGMSALKLVS